MTHTNIPGNVYHWGAALQAQVFSTTWAPRRIGAAASTLQVCSSSWAPCALSSSHPVLVFFVYLLFTLCCLLFVVLFHFYLIPPNNAGMFVILAFLLLVVYSLLFCFVFISFAPNNNAGKSTTWHLQWSRFLPLGMVTSSAKRMPQSSVRPLTLPVPSTMVIHKACAVC